MKPARYPYKLDRTACDHISEMDLAYLAGIIDGEGCIVSSYPRSQERPLLLKLGMVHRPTVQWIRDTVGGGVVAHRTHQQPARQSWTWQLGGVRAYALLRRMLPYMKTKREEAEVACEIGETFFHNQIRGRITEETINLRMRCGQLLRDLKRKEWRADE